MTREKWTMSEAAQKRIEGKITTIMAIDRMDRFEFHSVDDIEALCIAEDFARPRDTAIKLIAQWIREKRFGYITAYIFENECRRASDHAVAGKAMLDAVGMLTSVRADDRRRKRNAKEGAK